ncbi:radical SAM protein [Chloroflexota bacterium]
MGCVNIKKVKPSYLKLYESGELAKRAEALMARLASCDICPRTCRVNRLENRIGRCNSGFLPIVSACVAHFGEEPAISGSRGSGTIFFGNCNMRCVYCQNHQISQNPDSQRGNELSVEELAEKMLYLQNTLKCHNINLVTPSHFVPQILSALVIAAEKGLSLPLVYNTSSYDSLETLKTLDGVVDIYLADLRYGSDISGRRYSGVLDYTTRARAAITEMYRQVGDLTVDEDGVATKGLIVRHLILPGGVAGSRQSLTWLLGKVSPMLAVSIMAQYHPSHRAERYPEISRWITKAEYDEVVVIAKELGLENGWFQELDAAEHFLPDFTREERPFE